jgi:hypothetical protein
MRGQRIGLLLQRAAFGAALAGMILATGCVFEPRDPEDPSEVVVDWIRPIEPENVLFNMKASIDAEYSTNYSNSLHADFTFVQSFGNVEEAAPGYFDDWGAERELAALDALFNQAISLRVEWNFDPNEDLTESGDEAIAELTNYQLFVTRPPDSEVVYEGYAKLVMKYDTESSQWQLYRWDESENGSYQSWGRLRADLQIP